MFPQKNVACKGLNGLVPNRLQDITWTNGDQDLKLDMILGNFNKIHISAMLSIFVYQCFHTFVGGARIFYSYTMKNHK